MTEDEQILYDEYKSLKELQAKYERQAEAFEQSAAEQRTFASDFAERAAVIAQQLGFTS